MTSSWGSDVIVSMPSPLRPGVEPLVDMGGFCFTENGIAHNLTAGDLEAYLTPNFAPIPQANHNPRNP